MILKRFTLLSVLLIAFSYGGEYADAYLLSAIFPQSQALGQSAVAGSIRNGHALNNPGGFTALRQSNLTLAYDQFNGLSNTLVLESSLPIGVRYVMGLTIIHNSIPDLFFRPDLSSLSPITRRDSVLSLAHENGESIRYREDALFLSLARDFEFEINLGWKYFKIPCRVPLGVSLKYLDKILVDNRGLGVGIDMGGQLFFNLAGMSDALDNTEFSLGFMLHDILNTPVYWETEHQDAIKRGLVRGIGMHQRLEKYNLMLHLTTSVQQRYPDARQWGVEVDISKRLIIRAGTDGYIPSFGLGIGLKKFIIDYTFSQHELAGIQKIGINYHF